MNFAWVVPLILGIVAAVPLFAKVNLVTKKDLQLDLGIQSFINYTYDLSSNQNDFRVSRNYVTIEARLIRWLGLRSTLDVHQTTSGSWSARFKYAYGKFYLPLSGLVTSPEIEIGLVHVPWFAYEEHINHYRVDGPMFLEQAGVMNSADLGITISGLFGPPLKDSIVHTHALADRGTYGSFAFGVYNGGGYQAKEKNTNKVFMSRVSLRPLGAVFPHLEVSYFFVYGRGNLASSREFKAPDGRTLYLSPPRWFTHLAFLSLQHHYFSISVQYLYDRGNQAGDRLDQWGSPQTLKGYSAFAEAKQPQWHLSEFVRWDSYRWSEGDSVQTIRFGVGYRFFQRVMVLTTARHTQDGTSRHWLLKTSLQIDL